MLLEVWHELQLGLTQESIIGNRAHPLEISRRK